MPSVDTHCHIDLYNAPSAVAAKAEVKRVHTIAVTNLPSAFARTESLVEGRKYLRPALGLHPQNAYRYHFEIARMRSLLEHTSFVGEIGLDYSRSDNTDRQVQRYVLSQILDWCSLAGNKILSVHSRRAAGDIVSAIGPNFPGKVILHWFIGSMRQLEQAILYGYYFSVNAAMVKSKKGASLIPVIPRNRVLTETDGPYVQANREQMQPTDVVQVIRSLANLLNEEVEEMTKVVYENFYELLGRTNEKDWMVDPTSSI